MYEVRISENYCVLGTLLERKKSISKMHPTYKSDGTMYILVRFQCRWCARPYIRDVCNFGQLFCLSCMKE